MTAAVAIRARPIEARAKPAELLTTYPKGRRCALGLCGCDAPALLSIYNPDETCAVCTVKLDQVVTRAEPLEVVDDSAPVMLHRDGFVLNHAMVDALREAVTV